MKGIDALRAGVVILIFAVIFGAGWKLRGVEADRVVSDLKLKHSEAALQSEKMYSNEIRRITDKGAEVLRQVNQEVEDANTKIASLQADRKSLLAESLRLRSYADSLTTKATPSTDTPGPTTGGEATAGAGLVLAKLFRSAEEEAVELGPALDEAISRGLACERIYARARKALMELGEAQ